MEPPLRGGRYVVKKGVLRRVDPAPPPKENQVADDVPPSPKEDVNDGVEISQ